MLLIWNSDNASGGIDAEQGFADLKAISDNDPGITLADFDGDYRRVNYSLSSPGAPAARLHELTNGNFHIDSGRGPEEVRVVILPALSNFTLSDGSSIRNFGGVALPPQNSGLADAHYNLTDHCLVIYDTTHNKGRGYCAARMGNDGPSLDLWTPRPVLLYHELSHAFRIVTSSQLRNRRSCRPAPPEEKAAILEENELRIQLANNSGSTHGLRDPNNHCGQACGEAHHSQDGVNGPNTRFLATMGDGLQGIVESVVEVEEGYEMIVHLYNCADLELTYVTDVRAMCFDRNPRRLSVRLGDDYLSVAGGAITMRPSTASLWPQETVALKVQLPRTIARLAVGSRVNSGLHVEENDIGDAVEIGLSIEWAWNHELSNSNLETFPYLEDGHELRLSFERPA